MSGSFVEGVDNEVLISFVVLIAVIFATVFYYFKTSGNAVYQSMNFNQLFGSGTTTTEVSQEPQQSQGSSPQPQTSHTDRNSSRENFPPSTDDSLEHRHGQHDSSGSSFSADQPDGVRRRTGDFTGTSPSEGGSSIQGGEPLGGVPHEGTTQSDSSPLQPRPQGDREGGSTQSGNLGGQSQESRPLGGVPHEGTTQSDSSPLESIPQGDRGGGSTQSGNLGGQSQESRPLGGLPHEGTTQSDSSPLESQPQGDRGGGSTQSGNLGGQSHESSSSSSRISIRIKHHEDERNFGVDANITVGQLKRLCFPEEVAQGRRVRLIFSGRLLNDDNASISFYGVVNFSVVHAQISEVSEPEQHMGDADVELDVSRLFIPLLTVILCVSWYGLMTYRQLFNATSTVILVIVTAAYAFMVYAIIG